MQSALVAQDGTELEKLAALTDNIAVLVEQIAALVTDRLKKEFDRERSPEAIESSAKGQDQSLIGMEV
ncbi:hypothetical protein ANTPLA_LOCUS3734 [Anthophora plagiata]